MRRLKLGPLEIDVGVESREEADSAQDYEAVASAEQPGAEPGTDSSSWWWERPKHPLLAEVFVLVFAIGLIVYAAVNADDLLARPRLVGGFIAALLLVIVIGRRALLRVSGR